MGIFASQADLKRAAALSLSAVATVLLLLTFPVDPRVLAIQTGIICTVISSLAEFLYFWRRDGRTASLVISASPTQKLEMGASLLISGYALYSMSHFAFLIPHVWLVEIGWLCGLACSFLVFVFCWAAPVAYLIRKYNWSPKACLLAGWPFLVIALALGLRYLFSNVREPAIAPFVLLAMAGTRTCQKMAFPDMDPADLRRHPQ